jgi:diacylglycerol kinase (ATP)
MKGIRSAFTHEVAFRLEVFLFIFLAPLGLWLGTTGVERALLVSVLFVVLVAEMINSALEAVVDRIGDEKHSLAGRAKDMGSAAVFISIANAVVVWGLILTDIYYG